MLISGSSNCITSTASSLSNQYSKEKFKSTLTKENIILILLITACKISIVQAQSLDQIGKVPLLKVNGGISANATYYEGTSNRDPFSFATNGNLNFNISGVFNIPLSFSYTSQGFDYSTPFKINRLSLHPSYKWITTHIGDVNMTFSRYTVNGHLFTGGGVELSPKGPFKISALYGRFLKAVEYDEASPNILPNYDRFGYGIKSSYNFKTWDVELSLFSAKDKLSSLEVEVPSELGIAAQENVVASVRSRIQLLRNLAFDFEVAQSAVTENIDSPAASSGNFLSFLIDEKESTQYFNAFNANFSYSLYNGSIGAGYERIDPGYRTFGAYFFNNDLENITINASQNLFKNKLSLSINAGLQRDDLDNEKETQLQRVVSSVNASLAVSKKMDINASYSNFQSFTNVRDQFDDINNVDELNDRDTLNFKQIFQNASLGVVYRLMESKTKRQELSTQVNYQNSSEESGSLSNASSGSYNGFTTYTLEFPEKSLQYNGAIHLTYNDSPETSSITYGPTLAVRKSFFEKTLSTGWANSYNITSISGEVQNKIFSSRLNANYTYKQRHNLTLNVIFLLRDAIQRVSNDFTVRLGYAYSFDVKRPKFNFRKKTPSAKKEKQEETNRHYYRFRYKEVIYKGYANEIILQLLATTKSEYLKSKDTFGRNELLTMLSTLKEGKDPLLFQNDAISFLDTLYQYINFDIELRRQLIQTLEDLKIDTKAKNEEIKMSFRIAKFKMERHDLHKITPEERSKASDTSQVAYSDLKKEYQKQSLKYDAHHYITNRVFEINENKKEHAKEIEDIRLKVRKDAFKAYRKDGHLLNAEGYIEGEIIIYLDMEFRKTK